MEWTRFPKATRADRAWLRTERKRVRFIVDEDLARLAGPLKAAGWDAVDVRDLGLAHRDDEDILKRAHRDRRFILTKDRNFLKGRSVPPKYADASVIILRADDTDASLEALNLALRTFGWVREVFKGTRITVTPDGYVTAKAGYEATQRFLVPRRGPNLIWEE